MASIYSENLKNLDIWQLGRLLELSWHDIGGEHRNAELHDIIERLAKLGDKAAQSTLRLLTLQPDVLDYRYPASDYISSSDGHLCLADQLEAAISRQTTLYRRLSQMRGAPPVLAEISQAALSAVAPGSAVALFNRDELKSCVWIISAGGTVAFGEVYVPPLTIQSTLNAFFTDYDIDAAQSTRAPRQRTSSFGTSKHDGAEGVPRAGTRSITNSSSGQATLNALAAVLFPNYMLEGVKSLHQPIVVPYGPLGNVPFDALPVNEKGDEFISKFSTTIAPSLIDLFAPFADRQLNGSGKVHRRFPGERYVRVIPGCSELEGNARRRDASPRQGQGVVFSSPLVVGDPAFNDPDYDLPQLSGARLEAEGVAGLLGTHPLLGTAVTHDAVVQAAQNADLIYLATHGVSYGDNGLDGFIALANGARWSAKEVQSACLVRTALAVLSACQTGLGQNVSSGVIGLARGFQIAGVDNVVMSLWNVDDGATRMMMLDFMRRIRNGEDVASSLRQAKLHVRAQAAFESPRYWAGFTLFSANLSSVIVDPSRGN